MKTLFVACNYQNHMKGLETAAYNEELKFYRSCYSIQKSYVESIMQLFKSKYEQFINELIEHFSQPLRVLIKKFWLLKEESSEENLKEFLGLFKVYGKKFEKLLDNIDDMPKSDLINETFHKLIAQLDEEINKLNKESLNNLEKMNLDLINLNELSLQSDQLLIDIFKLTPDCSDIQN